MQWVGGSYLPSRLLWMLRKVDAYSAVGRFLGYLGFDYDALLASHAERLRLEESLFLLAEVDLLSVTTGLSDQPIYRAFETEGLEAARSLLGRMSGAADVLRDLESGEIEFGEYRNAFHKRARQIVENWEQAALDEIDRIHEAWSRWRELQDRYDALRGAIAAAVEEIAARSAEEHIETFLEDVVASVEEQVREARDGAREPAAVLEALEEILADLEAVLEGLGGRKADPYGRDSPLAHALRVLEVPPAAALDIHVVKRAFRRLVKIHHPDAGGDLERAKEINAAYSFLKRYLAS